jgi:hypothetical protein
MNTAQTTQARTQIAARRAIAPTLETEAAELDALHTGLVRHLSAWREAHEAAILRLGAVMARMDAILERVEHTAPQE